jgi:thiamine transport system substrate-binding protein
MKKLTLVSLLFAILVAACGQATPAPSPTPSGPRTLTVMVHDSFAVSEDVVAAFEAANNAKVQFIESGDAGSTLNKAILSKDNPLADVLYGVDNTFLSRALDEDIFEPYNAPLLSNIPDQFKLDPENRFASGHGDVRLNYDIAYFEENSLQPPQTLEDLLKPEYKGRQLRTRPLLRPARLLTHHHQPLRDRWLPEFWQGLVSNDVLVVNDRTPPITASSAAGAAAVRSYSPTAPAHRSR